MLHILTPQYLAGVFDAEGSISILKRQGRYVTHVTVTNNYANLARTIQTQYGGYIERKPLPYNKTSHQWQGDDSVANRFLSAVLPHVFIKRTAVWLGLCFEAFKQRKKRDIQERRKPNGTFAGFTPEEHEIRQSAVAIMKKINAATRRGSAYGYPKTLSSEYIAGFFDGEGSVSIIVQKRAGKPRLAYLHVQVPNNNARIPEAICRQYGGFISHHTSSLSSVISTQWDGWNLIAAAFLKNIYPYLIIKSNVVWLALCFQTYREARSPRIDDAQRAVAELIPKINDRKKGRR